MNERPRQQRMVISYTTLYLAFAASAARALFTVEEASELWFMIALLAVYLLLLLVTPLVIARKGIYLHGIIALLTAISLTLLLTVDKLDYFSLLFVAPCILSILNFSRKTALAWIVTISLLDVAALLVVFPLDEAVGYVIIYPAAIFLFVSMSYLALQAEEAKNRSEALLADLQQANRRLQAYSEQVQELAAAAERNRLARELHDSVTQIIFGLTLSAQAARILLDRDPPRAAAELDRLQGLAQNALAEMRGLIQQLRPRSIAEEGLVSALRRLAGERLATAGLTVEVQVNGERRLPARVEEELYCVAQEALNNIAKHAHTDQARMALDLADEQRVVLQIEDGGVGFDPAGHASQPGHLGLTSMAERVQALGGRLAIESQPGKGTRVRVELALGPEVEHVE